MDMKRRRVDDWATESENLQKAERKHARLHRAAYGTDLIIPKHHAALHIPKQARADQAIWDMFIIERLNQHAKAASEPIRNTTSFEHSVLSRIVSVQCNSLRSPEHSMLEGLIGTQKPFPLDPELACAGGVYLRGKQSGNKMLSCLELKLE